MINVERSSDYIIDSLSNFLMTTPAMTHRVKDLVQELFPHKTADIDTQKYAVRNLLRLAQFCPTVNEHIIRVVIEKIAVLDQDQLAIKDMDALLTVLLSWVDTEYTENLSDVFLNVFSDIILPTANPQYLQTIILIFCEKGGTEFIERFVTMLLNKIKLRQSVEYAFAYLVSYLTKFSTDILVTSTRLAIRRAIRFTQRGSKLDLFYIAVKYIAFLACQRPEILELEEFVAMVNHPTQPLQKVQLHMHANYDQVIEAVSYEMTPSYDDFFLPFNITVLPVSS